MCVPPEKKEIIEIIGKKIILKDIKEIVKMGLHSIFAN